MEITKTQKEFLKKISGYDLFVVCKKMGWDLVKFGKICKIYSQLNDDKTIDLVDEIFNNEYTFEIQEPIWATKSVGLNEEKMTDTFLIDILYKDKDGDKLYPNKYKFTKEKALKYPKDNKHPFLRVIPIKDLKIKE